MYSDPLEGKFDANPITDWDGGGAINLSPRTLFELLFRTININFKTRSYNNGYNKVDQNTF